MRLSTLIKAAIKHISHRSSLPPSSGRVGGIKEKEKGIKGDKLNLTRCHEKEEEGGAYFGRNSVTLRDLMQLLVSLHFALVGE